MNQMGRNRVMLVNKTYWSVTLTGALCLSLLMALPPTAEPASASTPASRQQGESRMDAAGIEQVWVPAGCFMMGSTDPDGFGTEKPPSWAAREKPSEMPAHEVCLSTGYWIDKYEVTNAAFQAFVDAGNYDSPDNWSDAGWNWRTTMKKINFLLPMPCEAQADPNAPRACVSWYEAEAYAKWRGGQLPTEAQWEFAARGPDSNIYPWGNTWDASKANVIDAESTVAVGSYPAGVSWVGAHDMAGNVMEWVNDWLDTKYYQKSVKDDPPGPEKGSKKVEKGGWWGSNAYVARSAYRHFEDPPTYSDHHIGFRIVTLDEPAK